ncbi:MULTISPECIES: cold-shock protein [Brevundimonas]|jgi:CspA family cold shock protein|uniref:Cold shock domain-containing protein n=1 Tax=Brevundimonas nasdae TaxID=172043 RepID=A0ABX8THR8_9CAUL|nr:MULTISPECIES: cold shock domain-containing protein [Brevundimonas]QYC09632.1 cold shock domain-containing protein [Brevundimonas nasdae]QYC15681.1 cold shock domain-containing protein [Brevundimonas nasdae]
MEFDELVRIGWSPTLSKEEAAMPTGTLKFVSPDGRFGMISRDDKAPKVFVHINEARRAGLDDLPFGARFRFDVDADTESRPRAINLERL